MTQHEQNIFYARVAAKLTEAMKRRNMSLGEVIKKSGEQRKTINGILAGKPHSFHHAHWMRKVLGININEIANHTEEVYGKDQAEYEKGTGGGREAAPGITEGNQGSGEVYWDSQYLKELI